MEGRSGGVAVLLSTSENPCGGLTFFELQFPPRRHAVRFVARVKDPRGILVTSCSSGNDLFYFSCVIHKNSSGEQQCRPRDGQGVVLGRRIIRSG